MTKEVDKKWSPDRSKFKDRTGKLITQSLFLENGYNTEFAVYTLTDEDKEYKGKVYPSLRRLYLECMDPTEYVFANTYLWGWEHWQRLYGNKLLTPEIDKWREELEVKLRSAGIRSILATASGNFNAAKWIADGSWKGLRGRPSKAELAREKKIRDRVIDSTKEDSDRISYLIPKKGNEDE